LRLRLFQPELHAEFPELSCGCVEMLLGVRVPTGQFEAFSEPEMALRRQRA
jgi:hypothetical protein